MFLHIVANPEMETGFYYNFRNKREQFNLLEKNCNNFIVIESEFLVETLKHAYDIAYIIDD